MKNIDSNTGKTTSACVYLYGNNIDKWEKVPRKSNFVSQLVNSYLNNELVFLNLKDEVKIKFEEDAYKDAIVNKLLEEYYKGNIMFIDEFIKTQTISQQLRNNTNFTSGESEQLVKNIDINSKDLEESNIEDNVKDSDRNILSSNNKLSDEDVEEHTEMKYNTGNETIKNDYIELDNNSNSTEELLSNDEIAVDSNVEINNSYASDINKEEVNRFEKKSESIKVQSINNENKETSDKDIPLAKKLRARRAAFGM